MTLQAYNVVWRHVCEDVLSIAAHSPEEAVRKAADGDGYVAASSPVQSLGYSVYIEPSEPILVANGLGEVAVRMEV